MDDREGKAVAEHTTWKEIFVIVHCPREPALQLVPEFDHHNSDGGTCELLEPNLIPSVKLSSIMGVGMSEHRKVLVHR